MEVRLVDNKEIYIEDIFTNEKRQVVLILASTLIIIILLYGVIKH